MRRPVIPPASDPFSRRFRDSIRDVLDWFDAGTRTQDLPQLDVTSSDLIELVRKDGTRYATTVGELTAAPLPTPTFTGPLLGALGTDSWNLEARTLTNPDLAAAGWTVAFQNSPFTVLTRAGDVDGSQPWAPTGKYNSTLVGGVLVLQFPAMGGAVQISKATSGGTHTYSSHMWGSDFNNGNSNYSFIADTTGHWNDGTATFFYGGVENTNYVEAKFGPGGFVLLRNQACNKWESDQVRYIQDNPGVDSWFGWFNANGMSIDPNHNSRSDISAAAHMGVFAIHRIYHFCFLDFIRRKPLLTFP